MARSAASLRSARAELERAAYADTARAAGLQYIADETPGFTRRRQGKGFAYYTLTGTRVRAAATLARIAALAIPPAWTDVWICGSERGHIQATGRDARGRKQYRYHKAFSAERDRCKYERMFQLARALPVIREACERDMRRNGLPREKVLAAIIRLLEHSLIRVGNEEYSRTNHSYGLTTLRNRHVRVRGAQLRFHFRGKSGVTRDVSLRDARLAAIVTRCRALRGALLFQYLDDDGRLRAATSGDVNAYLREITGQDLSAKDFRTFYGSVLTALALREQGPAASARAAKRQINAAVRSTSERLGNTVAVCRRAYVHPALLSAYEQGTIMPRLAAVASGAAARRHAEERAVIAFLKRCAARFGC